MTLEDRVHQASFRSPAEEAGVSVLVAGAHLAHLLEEVCSTQGITHDQYNVLRILRGVYPDGHPRYEIGRRLIERSPDVTRLLDRLERRGLVSRYRAEGDRRLSLARIYCDERSEVASRFLVEAVSWFARLNVRVERGHDR